MTVTVKIDGLKELNFALKKLPEAVAQKHLKGAVGKAASVIRNQVTQNIATMFNEQTGTLRRAVYTKAIKELSSLTRQTYFVGVRSGKKFQARKLKSGKLSGNRDAYYWKFLEFGHHTRPSKAATGKSKSLKRGRGRAAQLEGLLSRGEIKWVPPKSFLRSAFEQKKMESIDALKAKLLAAINKEAKLVGKK